MANTPKHVRSLVVALLLMPTLLFAQRLAVKSNLLYAATGTFNAAMEAALSPRWTLSVPANYNPWVFGGDMQWRHWLVQPEVRYWFCEAFNGSFVGVNACASGYNVSGLPLGKAKEYRYEGKLYGAGVSYGHHWILSTRWSIEAVAGIGYARMQYEKYNCGRCAEKVGAVRRHYFGPTQVGVSLIYLIR